jgi:hypothetical protein
MREPISRDSASPRELAEATRRLDRALEQLESACAAKVSAPMGSAERGGYAALESDRVRLTAELDAARVREAELEAAAAAASQALGRAAAEVRAVLGEDDDASTSDGERSGGQGLNEEAA